LGIPIISYYIIFITKKRKDLQGLIQHIKQGVDLISQFLRSLQTGALGNRLSRHGLATALHVHMLWRSTSISPTILYPTFTSTLD